MKRAFLKILPNATPGLTVAEIQERVVAYLPEELFPDGAKAGWWTEAVQLDLEAKRIVCKEGVNTVDRSKNIIPVATC